VADRALTDRREGLKRVKRRLFNAGAVVSLAMFVALTVLWVGSHWRGYNWVRPNSASLSIYSIRGTLGISTPPGVWPGAGTRGLTSIRVYPSWKLSLASLWRFEFGWREVRGPSFSNPVTAFRAEVPYWLPALLLVVIPGLWLWRHPRRVPATCPACGYDLRGTPAPGRGETSGVKTCPECGSPGTRPRKDPASPANPAPAPGNPATPRTATPAPPEPPARDPNPA
jgi:hypothetical protein